MTHDRITCIADVRNLLQLANGGYSDNGSSANVAIMRVYN